MLHGEYVALVNDVNALSSEVCNGLFTGLKVGKDVDDLVPFCMDLIMHESFLHHG